MVGTFLQNPQWLHPYFFTFKSVNDVPPKVYEDINFRLDAIQYCPEPDVSILITAWNEEVNLIPCLSSLANTKSESKVEIIVVNNNSSDRTQEVLDNFHVIKLFQPVQGCGPARQMGLEIAKGKYVLLADADCIYPSNWVDEMIGILSKPNVACVYGRYSFISEKGFPRWQLYVFERMKDILAEYRQIKHPYFNAYGLSMGFRREPALEIGFITDNFWGDDGQLCMGLMKFGKVMPMKKDTARVWTGSRTLKRSGSLVNALIQRLIKECRRAAVFYFKKQQPQPWS